MTGAKEHFAVQVSGGKTAAATARRALLDRNGRLPGPVREDVLLLVSELVTNAVCHADVGPEGSVEVGLDLSPDRVRVEVADPGNGFSGLPPESLEVGGWGLRMVDEIADDWGVASADPGTCVWFEIRLAA